MSLAVDVMIERFQRLTYVP